MAPVGPCGRWVVAGLLICVVRRRRPSDSPVVDLETRYRSDLTCDRYVTLHRGFEGTAVVETTVLVYDPTGVREASRSRRPVTGLHLGFGRHRGAREVRLGLRHPV